MLVSKLQLKSIGKILNENFYIPSYQRGYRWDKQQVLELLNDIYEFSKKSKDENAFYCLQPIVLFEDKENNYYKVIDGQQRLTTIYIILKYLNDLLFEEYGIEEFYKIDYETRESSKFFLEEDISKGISYDNIDFYYMSITYQTVKKWFIEKIKNREITKRRFLEILLGFHEKKDIKFIWYELNEDEDEIDVFTRLNIGKIPLTNAELIKAILLFGLEAKEKLELVMFWDYIEKRLQDDNFFYFLTNETKYKNTRIDFIFELISQKHNKNFDNKDSRFSFYVFEYLIKDDNKNQKKLWNEVKEYFRIFEELYNNNIYYHYIGFLINSKKINIDDIIKLFKNNKKDDFQKELENDIKKKIGIEFKELDYNENKKDIEYFLFLFNILITMDSKYGRYPFDRHNQEKWSLEHIHAQNSEDIKKDRDRRSLLNDQKDYIDNEDLKNRIKEILDNKENIDKSKFNEIQQEIFKKFSDDIDIHTIDNLALLSIKDNSVLSNNIFPYKRKIIKELDEKGSFIPLGTKNVFMKYYSDEVKEAITWNREDRESYLKILENRLKDFIEVKK